MELVYSPAIDVQMAVFRQPWLYNSSRKPLTSLRDVLFDRESVPSGPLECLILQKAAQDGFPDG